MAQEKARLTRVRKKKEEPEAVEAAAKPVRRRRRKAPPVDAVAFHAYLLWESGEPGDATEHWLRAERELAAA